MIEETEEAVGRHAHSLLNDEFLQRSIEKMKEDLKERFVATRVKDKELREEIYFEYQGVLKFEQKLKAVLDNANLAGLRKRKGD